MGEEQLTAADLSERVDQIVNPDHLFSAGQAVPNLRSLHRQLPSSGRALRASNAQAEGNNDNDTFIIPMAQLGSAGVRQVTACNPLAAALHQTFKRDPLPQSEGISAHRMRPSQWRCSGWLSLEAASPCQQHT